MRGRFGSFWIPSLCFRLYSQNQTAYYMLRSSSESRISMRVKACGVGGWVNRCTVLNAMNSGQKHAAEKIRKRGYVRSTMPLAIRVEVLVHLFFQIHSRRPYDLRRIPHFLPRLLSPPRTNVLSGRPGSPYPFCPPLQHPHRIRTSCPQPLQQCFRLFPLLMPLGLIFPCAPRRRHGFDHSPRL